MDDSQDEAQRANYATDENILRRQSLMNFVVPTEVPEPALWDHFNWHEDSVVLDVGCGNGLWTRIAADRTGSGLTVGLDLSRGMLDAVRVGAPSSARVQGEAQNLPFARHAADAILALWMMYHVPDREAMLREVVRVLKPGGLFIATTNAARPLGDLEDLYFEAAQRTAGRVLQRWLPPLDFNAENGDEALAHYFAGVQVTRRTVRFVVPDPEPIVTYASSLREPVVEQLVLTSASTGFLPRSAS